MSPIALLECDALFLTAALYLMMGLHKLTHKALPSIREKGLLGDPTVPAVSRQSDSSIPACSR